MAVGAACRSVIVHATSTGTLKRWTQGTSGRVRLSISRTVRGGRPETQAHRRLAQHYHPGPREVRASRPESGHLSLVAILGGAH